MNCVLKRYKMKNTNEEIPTASKVLKYVYNLKSFDEYYDIIVYTEYNNMTAKIFIYYIPVCCE